MTEEFTEEKFENDTENTQDAPAEENPEVQQELEEELPEMEIFEEQKDSKVENTKENKVDPENDPEPENSAQQTDKKDNPQDESIQEQDLEVQEDKDEESPEQDDIEITMESVVEAVLFANDESVSITKLTSVTETTAKQVREHIKYLNKKYKENGHCFRIEKIAGGFQMMTLPPYDNWLRKLIKVRGDSKLSAAALETLAIIAYKQPIIRADVENIRGVSSGEMIRNLMSKGLVKIKGRAEMLGRPMLYGTTKKFLEVFGLNTLNDLPKVEELQKPEE